jgi:hypothetical protein
MVPNPGAVLQGGAVARAGWPERYVASAGGIRGCLSAGLIAIAALAGAAPAHAAFEVGAARTDTTPPAFDPAHDARDLGPGAAACPAAVWSGPRPFDFEEPYQDSDSSGQFDYPEPYCDLNGNDRWDGIWVSGGPQQQAQAVREDDRPSARAVAISEGGRTIVSVTAEGIFENYVAKIRALVAAARPDVQPGDVIVSADLARHGGHQRRAGPVRDRVGAAFRDRRLLHERVARPPGGEGGARRGGSKAPGHAVGAQLPAARRPDGAALQQLADDGRRAGTRTPSPPR